ncbi:hypothetical protein SAMN05216382_0609 [Sphingomonas palmae]|uniref:Beta/Gamma crystallin n=1 Tax=Sphingomonas palmae TaxID=1855283 RepID=A0A1H7HX12_9SPHN|nr:hypothetical protein [Sphingomonas palmae]SEK54142.1 hypothetical protein SAMN05216382_0609 [Sphingomonas palmae]
MRYAALACCLVLLAAPGAAHDRNTVPEATPTGPARNCVPITQLRDSLVRSDRVVDFRTTGGRDRYYRVTLPQSCPGLGFERRFSYATSIGQLCAQDIITVLYQGSGPTRGASCGLAPLQPVTIARAR